MNGLQEFIANNYLLILVMTGAAVTLFMMVALQVFFNIEAKEMDSDGQEEPSPLAVAYHEVFERLTLINKFLPIPGYRQRVTHLLEMTGEANKKDVYQFLAEQELAVIVIFVTIYFGLGYRNFVACMLLASIGPLMLYLDLSGKLSKRKEHIVSQLPYFMDLMTLTVEAGADFMFAIKTIIGYFPEGPLKFELNLLQRSVLAGRSRAEALTQMKTRIDLPEMNSLCLALIQADETGASLGKVLREQSTAIKGQLAEAMREKAKKASSKMLFPLVLFIFPCFFILILGGVAIRTYANFTGWDIPDIGE